MHAGRHFALLEKKTSVDAMHLFSGILLYGGERLQKSLFGHLAGLVEASVEVVAGWEVAKEIINTTPLPYTNELKKSLARGWRFAENENANEITIPHVVAGIIQEAPREVEASLLAAGESFESLHHALRSYRETIRNEEAEVAAREDPAEPEI